jgi:hypothetical protein
MYLNQVKQLYKKLLELMEGRDAPKPCTEDKIHQLSSQLGLVLPEAYIEFLQWTGSSGGCFAGDEFDAGRVATLNPNNCRGLLEAYGKLESFPKDAIFIVFYQGGYAFDFIRASEGNNPPVHRVLETEQGLEITWEISENLEEHCLKIIQNRIKLWGGD